MKNSSILLLLCANLLASCESRNIDNSNPIPKEQSKTPIVVGIERGGYNSTKPLLVDYFTMSKRSMDEITYFKYHYDSTYRIKTGVTEYGTNYEARLSIYQGRNLDTLFIETLPLNTQYSYMNDYLKCLIKDSLEIKSNRRSFKIYCYKNLDDDPRSEITYYFSPEIGFLFAHIHYYKKIDRVVMHTAITKKEREDIIDAIESNR
jgi:hypothetical protein